MGQAFNQGKRENFFTLWTRHVPMVLRQEDLICQKLEFYLHIYFTVYPAFMGGPNQAANEKDLRRELNEFKTFLDTRGQDLSKTSEFLQYYALPYVSNPLQHPTFRAVCTKKWATELRNKLKEFLEANISKNTSPAIFHWYANFKKRAGPAEMGGGPGVHADAEELKERLLMMQRHYIMLEKKEEYAKSTLIESQSKWTLFSKDILNIAKELHQTMEAY